MINILLGSWSRRILTAAACLLAFVISLCASVTVAIGRAPATAPLALKIPLVGNTAVALAERYYGPLAHPEPVKDVPSVRELRPLSSEEIGQLIQDLKQQRQLYVDRLNELDREAKRLELYRQELAQERGQMDDLRNKVVSQWDEVKKAREGLDKHVTDIQSLESKNLKQLAGSYEAMKADKAALVVQKLAEGMAAKTLFLMKERAAAKIIEQLDPETAAKLVDKMAVMRQVD